MRIYWKAAGRNAWFLVSYRLILAGIDGRWWAGKNVREGGMDGLFLSGLVVGVECGGETGGNTFEATYGEGD